MPFTEMGKSEIEIDWMGESESFVSNMLGLKHPWESQVETSRMNSDLELGNSKKSPSLENTPDLKEEF